MILLKAFFRSKSTKIYLFIFTILLFTILIFYNYICYYSNIITKTYQENSYFLIVSDNNIFDKIKGKKFVVNLKKVILFERTNTLDNLNIKTSDFFDLGNDYIIAINDEKNIFSLKKQQVAIGVVNEMLQRSKDIYNLEQKQIKFYNGLETQSFSVKKVYESKFARIILPNIKFIDLLKKQKIFGYVFSIYDYEKNYSNQKEIENISGVSSVEFIQSYESEQAINTLAKLKNIILILKTISCIITIIFLILFLIVTKNLISDEIENMNIERLIGYSKSKIRLILSLKIILLDLLIFCFSILIYIIYKYLYFMLFGAQLYNSNYLFIIIFYFIILFLSLFFCFFSKMNKKVVL